MPCRKKFQVKSRRDTLSVCMIVRDEQDHLGFCLESIQGVADQIVVVDTGSTDGTIAVAEKYGAHIVRSDWRDDFSYARNISLEYATSRWVLWLDADDRVPPSEQAKLHLLKTAPPDRAFFMKIRNVRPGGFGEQWFQLRMFPNHPAIHFEREIHEQVGFAIKRLGLQVLKVDVRIDHVGYENPDTHKRKASRNRKVLLAKLARYREDPSYVNSLADSYFITDEFEEAIRWYQKALSLYQSPPAKDDIYRQIPTSIALSYQRLGDFEKALDWVEKALAADPGKIDSLFLGAALKEGMGDLPGAIGFYEQIDQAPGIPTAYATDHEGLKARALICLGKLYKKLQQTDQAERAYRSCMEKYPSVLNTYSELAELLWQKAKFQEAAHVLEQGRQFLSPRLAEKGTDPSGNREPAF